MDAPSPLARTCAPARLRAILADAAMLPRRASLLAALFSLALAGCADGESRDSAFTSSPPGVTSATSLGSTGAPTSTDGGSTGGSGEGTSTPTGDATTAPGTSATSGTTVPNPDGLPNGAECMSNAQCMTDNCYKINIPVEDLPPGICSECDADADCVAAGTGISCTVDSGTLGGVCTDGGLGSYCQSQAACQPQLFCDPLIDGAQGLLPNACNECRTDGDCDAPKRCVPAIDIVAYTGKKSCLAPGTVANDGLCPLTGGGPICLSGICNILDVGGLLEVGVCGECAADADCAQIGLTTCTPSKFDSGFIGSVCM